MENAGANSDKELFTRISEGDEIAFAEIFYRYTAKLAPFVKNFLHADLWTEEIVQDVFLRLWQNRNKLSNVEHPSAYIYQIASNRALDYIKKNAREIKLHYYINRTQESLDINQTEADVNCRNTERILKEAIQKLPPQRRKVYEMAREQGISHEEIARALNISTHTVRNHVAEALQEIRIYLKENGALPSLVILFLINI